MKIGILTFHRPINYGAFLQSYSLSSKLRREGYDVEIIDYEAPKERKRVYINVLWTLKHFGFKNFLHEIKKVLVFRNAQKHLIKSPKRFLTENLNDLYQYIDNTYDVLIIGSDAVFNWMQNGFPSAFLPDFKFRRCKVYSYAASVHGLRYLDKHLQSKDILNKIFGNFKLVGVRDHQSEEFVKYYNDSANIEHCCDPTFFIDIDDIFEKAGNYKQRILSKYGVDLNSDYIAIMLPNDKLNKVICDHYRGKYKIISLFNPSENADFFLYDLNPFEWVAVLSCAKGVITSYFHGTLLSLKVGTPTVSIDYSNYGVPYESKMYDLYNRRLKIPDLYYSSSAPSEEILKRFDEAIQGQYCSRVNKAFEAEKSKIDNFLNHLK